MRSPLLMQMAIALAMMLAISIATPAAATTAAAAVSAPVASLAAVDWAHLNATTLAALNATEFLAVTKAQLTSIPAAACAGFSADQVAKTGASTSTGPVCGGFTPDCIATMPPTAIAGLTTSCAAALTPASVGALTGTQLMSGLPDAVCGVWSWAQTAAFAPPKCQHLGMICLQQWTPASMGGFSAACVKGMTSAQIATFTAPQISGINVTAATAITSSNNGMMTKGCAGWTADQFSVMPTDAFYGWTVTCTSYFTPAGLGGWVRAQMRAYNRRLFWTWSVPQVAGLSPLGASGISPAAAKGLPPALCKGFHASQIALFRDFYTQNVCEQWSPACLSNIAPAEYSGFSQLCIQRLRTDSVAALVKDQVANIKPVTFASIWPKQLAVFSASACSGIQAGQMEMFDQSFPGTGCSGFTVACFSSMSNEALSALTQQCVSHVPPKVLASLSAEQFAALPDNAFSSMTRDSVAALLPAHCGQISAKQLGLIGSVFPNDAMLGMSAACLGALPASTCAGITPTFLAAFAAAPADVQAQLAGLKSECVASLPTEACANAGATFFNNMATESCAALTPSCMGSVTAAGVSGMGVPCFTALQPAVFAALTRPTVAGLNASQCAVVTGEKLSLIGTGSDAPDAAQGLTSDCLGALSGSTCGGANDHLFHSLEGTACVGFTTTCFGNVTANGASGLEKECVATLQSATFAALPLESFRALKADAFSGVTRADAELFAPERCAILTGDALNKMGSVAPFDAPLGLSNECLAVLPASACAHTGAHFFNIFNATTESLAKLGSVGHSCLGSLSCGTFDSLFEETRGALNHADVTELTRVCADGGGGSSKERTKWILIGVFCGTAALILLGWVVRKCMKKNQESHTVNDASAYQRAPEDM